jgi:serine/threonine protein kinase
MASKGGQEFTDCNEYDSETMFAERHAEEHPSEEAVQPGSLPATPRASSLDVPFASPATFRLVELLGQGSYGEVWLAVSRASDSQFVIKRLHRYPFARNHELERWRLWNAPSSNAAPIDYAERERELVSQIPPHPNLVQCIAWLPWSFPEEANEAGLGSEGVEPDLALVMERGYPLAHLFQRDQNLVSDSLWLRLIRVVCRALFSALAHLHAHGFVHRDIRLDHVLSRVDPEALGLSLQAGRLPQAETFFLCDYSLLRRCSANTDADGASSPTLTYAPMRSPELYFGETRRLPSSDIWAAGCVLLELLFRQAGEPVFDCGTGTAMSELRSLKTVFDLLGNPPECFKQQPLAPASHTESVSSPHGSDNIAARIHRCWNNDVDQDVIEQAIDLVQRLLDYCEARRPTAVQVLEHPFLQI